LYKVQTNKQTKKLSSLYIRYILACYKD